LPLILNIETSSAICSVCLSRDGEVISLKEDNSGTNHASRLTIFIQELLDQNNLSIQELDAIAVSAGPGSYTGLRIGVATAKGICFSITKPLIAVDSLHALAEGMIAAHPNNGFLYCPTIDARRDEIYYSLIDLKSSILIPSNNVILAPTIPFDIPGDKSILVGGTGAAKTIAQWNNSSLVYDETTLGSSKNMIAISNKKFYDSQFENVASFEPAYIKPAFINPARRGS